MQKNIKEYWRKNLILIGVLLAIWAVVSLGFSILIVEPLNSFRIGGFPLGFWFAHQGAMYAFVILIGVYCVLINRLDKKYDVEEK